MCREPPATFRAFFHDTRHTDQSEVSALPDVGYQNVMHQCYPFLGNLVDLNRLRLRAKLDAVFFHLYGVTDRDDVRYVYSTFPIVERQEMQAHGCYHSRELCLTWINALAAGNPNAEIRL